MPPDKLALLEHDVLMARADGLTPQEVAVKLSISHGDALSIIGRLTDTLREENAGYAQELFVLSNLRLERLWKWVQARLDSLTVADGNAIQLIRAAVQIVERQARLNGLDRTPRPSGVSADADWIDAATPSEMAAYLKRHGFTLPESLTVTP